MWHDILISCAFTNWNFTCLILCIKYYLIIFLKKDKYLDKLMRTLYTKYIFYFVGLATNRTKCSSENICSIIEKCSTCFNCDTSPNAHKHGQRDRERKKGRDRERCRDILIHTPLKFYRRTYNFFYRQFSHISIIKIPLNSS